MSSRCGLYKLMYPPHQNPPAWVWKLCLDHPSNIGFIYDECIPIFQTVYCIHLFLPLHNLGYPRVYISPAIVSQVDNITALCHQADSFIRSLNKFHWALIICQAYGIMDIEVSKRDKIFCSVGIYFLMGEERRQSKLIKQRKFQIRMNCKFNKTFHVLSQARGEKVRLLHVIYFALSP